VTTPDLQPAAEMLTWLSLVEANGLKANHHHLSLQSVAESQSTTCMHGLFAFDE